MPEFKKNNFSLVGPQARYLQILKTKDFTINNMKQFGWLSVLIIALTASLGALYIDRNFFRGSPMYSGDGIESGDFLSKYASDSLPAFGANINFVAACRKVRSSVVYIRSGFGQKEQNLQQFHPDIPDFDDLFRSPQGPQEAGGSGVILSAGGLIVTNFHVIDGATSVEVVLHNKQSYPARVVGKDPSTDLALLKIEASGLPFASFGDSDKLEAGEWVLAIGNPFDLTSTVTAGIISGKGRNINIIREKSNLAIESFIQTDAAVNPGNSGGALVNLRGELIGINTAIASPTGSYSGYSFAIPSNLVKKVVGDLNEFGSVQRGLLGVVVRDVDASLAKEKGLPAIEGVFVQEVNEGSAADAGGIKKGDIILKINGTAVNSVPELQESVGRYRPGQQVKTSIRRGSEIKELNLVLKDVSGSTKLSSSSSLKSEELAAEFSVASPAELKRAGAEFGMKVEELSDGPLKDAGVESGFILLRLDKKPFRSLADLHEIYRQGRGGMLLEVLNEDGEKAYLVLVRPAAP
jgi:Do/DeqQ family serine protease